MSVNDPTKYSCVGNNTLALWITCSHWIVEEILGLVNSKLQLAPSSSGHPSLNLFSASCPLSSVVSIGVPRLIQWISSSWIRRNLDQNASALIASIASGYALARFWPESIDEDSCCIQGCLLARSAFTNSFQQYAATIKLVSSVILSQVHTHTENPEAIICQTEAQSLVCLDFFIMDDRECMPRFNLILIFTPIHSM